MTSIGIAGVDVLFHYNILRIFFVLSLLPNLVALETVIVNCKKERKYDNDKTFQKAEKKIFFLKTYPNKPNRHIKAKNSVTKYV